MSIQNGLGITGYSRRMSLGFEGSPAKSELPLGRPYRVALVAQVNTITIASFGADTDAVTVSITLPDGTVISETTTRAAGVPVDDAAAAAALVLLINARAALNSHVDASSDSAVLTLTFKHTNVVYGVATSVVGCTATVAQTQAPGGTAITPGRFVRAGASVGGLPAVTALATSSTEADVRGIVERELAAVNAGSALATAVDQTQPPAVVSVAYQGEVLMRNNGSVAAAPGGIVYVVNDAAGGDEVGEARADVDGVAQVATVTPDAAQHSVTVAIEIRLLTGPYAGYSKVLLYQTDASMTATEVCDAFRTDLNLDSILAAQIVDTGTATLILTAVNAGTTFEVNAVEGAFTIDEATVAADAYTIALPTSRAYWAEAVAAGAIGPIMLRM